MKRRISLFSIVLAVLLVSSLSARENDPLFSSPVNPENVPSAFLQTTEALRSVSWVKADFTEQRRLPYLKNSVRSQGVVIYAPKVGLSREVVSPVRQKLILGKNRPPEFVNESGETGDALAQSRELQFVGNTFLSIFSGEREEWEKNFELFFLGTETNWQLGFKPRRKNPLSKAVLAITLKGSGPQLRAMIWEGKEGDVTETVFELQDLRTGLSENEVQTLFDHAIGPAPSK